MSGEMYLWGMVLTCGVLWFSCILAYCTDYAGPWSIERLLALIFATGGMTIAWPALFLLAFCWLMVGVVLYIRKFMGIAP